MIINNLLNTFEINIAKKFDIIRLFNDGLSERYIVKETGTPKSKVHNIISKYKNNTIFYQLLLIKMKHVTGPWVDICLIVCLSPR